MAISLYDFTIPVFLRGFASLAAFLEKARAHADAEGIPHADLLEARLIDDMNALPSQIQRASDAAKLAAVRLAQVENVPMADDEASFDDLQRRIARTVEFLQAITPEALDGREEAMIAIKLPNRSFELRGIDYVRGFAVPNFYFHLTAAYAILRHKGVPLGKQDFLGGI